MSLAPPAKRDGWSYSGEFHVEASGHNHHRRATIPELRAVFDGSAGSKDRPAHWYEAQLIHYGLPPSKVKGTAKMRLLDAVSKGNLVVPSHILKTEAELKKEWTKRERKAKQALKKLPATTRATPARGPNKRKADDGQAGVASRTNVNVNLSLSIGPQGNVQVAPAGPASKRAKTTSTARKSTPAKPTLKRSTQAAPRTKQTARRGSSTISRRLASSVPSNEPAARQRQTARRSRPFSRAGQGRSAVAVPQPCRIGTTPSQWDSPDGPPPPYPGSPRQPVGSYSDDGYDSRNDDQYDSHSDDGYDSRNDDHHDSHSDDGSDSHSNGHYDSHSDNASDSYNRDSYDSEDDDGGRLLPPLGLLNGRYRLRCTAPRDFADRGEDSFIIFTLDGDALWGSFEIGPLSGILRLDKRPWTSSRLPLYFDWRGDDDQGNSQEETDDGSYVKFMGDGEIVGKIGFYNSMLEFDGYRVSGQETRSEISAASMRRRWEERGL